MIFLNKSTFGSRVPANCPRNRVQCKQDYCRLHYLLTVNIGHFSHSVKKETKRRRRRKRRRNCHNINIYQGAHINRSDNNPFRERFESNAILFGQRLRCMGSGGVAGRTARSGGKLYKRAGEGRRPVDFDPSSGTSASYGDTLYTLISCALVATGIVVRKFLFSN